MNKTLENKIEEKYSKLINNFQETIINNIETIEILFYSTNLFILNYSLQKENYITATSSSIAIGASIIGKYFINKLYK